jgi:hypothetical protein
MRFTSNEQLIREIQNFSLPLNVVKDRDDHMVDGMRYAFINKDPFSRMTLWKRFKKWLLKAKQSIKVWWILHRPSKMDYSGTSDWRK